MLAAKSVSTKDYAEDAWALKGNESSAVRKLRPNDVERRRHALHQSVLQSKR